LPEFVVRLIALALFALLLCPLASAQTFSSLEERMSEADFRAAGLHRLSPEELARLNEWLRDQAAQAPAPAAAQDRRGLPAEYNPSDAIVARIPGEFRGWSGAGTRIELDNGQVWEVTDSSTRLAVNLQDPTVRIAPGFMNAWFLQVDGYNTKARVKRIR
jgi:hypothetical protein